MLVRDDKSATTRVRWLQKPETGGGRGLGGIGFAWGLPDRRLQGLVEVYKKNGVDSLDKTGSVMTLRRGQYRANMFISYKYDRGLSAIAQVFLTFCFLVLYAPPIRWEMGK